jgi:steroid delta-isomerase
MRAMPDASHIRQVYERYPELVTKTDIDAIVSLYADDATLEDPIGSPLRRGKDAIRDFYEQNIAAATMKRSGPVRVAGSEAATPLVILIGAPGQEQALDIISVMTFDEAGLITSMRAYWSMDAMRPATDADRSL